MQACAGCRHAPWHWVALPPCPGVPATHPGRGVGMGAWGTTVSASNYSPLARMLPHHL